MGLTLSGVWPPWVKKDLITQFGGGEPQKWRLQLMARHSSASWVESLGQGAPLGHGVGVEGRMECISSFFYHSNLKPSGPESQWITKNLLVTGHHWEKKSQFMFGQSTSNRNDLPDFTAAVKSVSLVLPWVGPCCTRFLCQSFFLCKTWNTLPTVHKTGRTELGRNAMELAQCTEWAQSSQPLPPAPTAECCPGALWVVLVHLFHLRRIICDVFPHQPECKVDDLLKSFWPGDYLHWSCTLQSYFTE